MSDTASNTQPNWADHSAAKPCAKYTVVSCLSSFAVAVDQIIGLD